MITKDEQLKKEIEKLESKSYCDLELILAQLNLNDNSKKIIRNTFNLECLDNQLLGRQEKEKELLNEFLEHLKLLYELMRPTRKEIAGLSSFQYKLDSKIKEIQERLSKLQ